MDEPTANGTANETTPDKAGSTSTRRPPSRQREKHRHGLFLAGSSLPGMGYVERQVGVFRRELENATLAVHGEINVPKAALIHSACEWTRHSLRCAYWLEQHNDELQPTERAKLSYAVAQATSMRDKCIERLSLDRSADPYALPPLPDVQP